MQKVFALQLTLPLLFIITEPISVVAGSSALVSDTGCDIIEDATVLLQTKFTMDKNEQSSNKEVLKESSNLDIPIKFRLDVPPSPAKSAKKGEQRSLSQGRQRQGKLSFIKEEVGSLDKVTENAAVIPSAHWKAQYDHCHTEMMNGMLAYDSIMYASTEKGYFTWQNVYDEYNDYFNIQGNGALDTTTLTQYADLAMGNMDLNLDGFVSFLEAAKYWLEQACSAVGLSVQGVRQAEADNREYEEQGSSYYVVDGAPLNTVGGHQSTACASANGNSAAIRCCSHAGDTCVSLCTSPVPTTQAEAFTRYTTHEYATVQCIAVGRRLCTQLELESNICRGSGCHYDKVLVWTSDRC